MKPLPTTPYGLPRLDDATSADVAARALTDAANPTHVRGVLRHLAGKGVRATAEQIRQSLEERAHRFLAAEEADCEVVQTDAHTFVCETHPGGVVEQREGFPDRCDQRRR